MKPLLAATAFRQLSVSLQNPQIRSAGPPPLNTRRQRRQGRDRQPFLLIGAGLDSAPARGGIGSRCSVIRRILRILRLLVNRELHMLNVYSVQ